MAAYLEATDQKGSSNAYGLNLATLQWAAMHEYSWENPGYEQQDDHPVVCISWDEA
jgi:formylglycine-generating enzyme required for sulfatase activity